MNYIGTETSITVNGQGYKLSRYSRRLAHELAEWVGKQIGNPLDDIANQLEGFPEACQDVLIDHAKQLAQERTSLYSERFWGVWQSLPGRVYELGLLLRRYHPQVDSEQLFFDAVAEHGDDYLPQAVIRTIGKMPQAEADVERSLLEEWGLLPSRVKEQAGAIDWLAIDKVLLKSFNLKPADLDEMTITEIMVLVESLKAEAEANAVEKPIDKADFEYKLQWAKIQKQLTPQQRLAIALKQCGL